MKSILFALVIASQTPTPETPTAAPAAETTVSETTGPAPQQDLAATSPSTSAPADAAPLQAKVAEADLHPEASGADKEGRFPVDVRAAFGEGVMLRGLDGSFGVEARARVQVRATTIIAPDAEDEDERIAFGAVPRRVRLNFNGFALKKAVTWKLQLNFAPQDLEPDAPVPLRDAFMTFHAAPEFNLSVGQMKVPFNRQRVISSSALQFPDRSAVNNELNLDRDVGVQAYATDLFQSGGRFTYALGLFAGNGRNRVITRPGLLAIGRFQVAPFGKFDDMTEGDLERGEDLRLALAASAAYNGHSRRERSTVGRFFDDIEGAEGAHVDYAHGELDGHLKWRGLSLLGEVIARSAVGGTDTAPARSALGAFIQGGYMVTDHVEVVARAGHLEPLTEDWTSMASVIEPSTELAGGANVYVIGHDLKVQSDFIYEPDAKVPIFIWRVQTQFYF